SAASFQPGPAQGLAAADALCGAEAQDAGLPGSYRALLAVADAGWESRFTGGQRRGRPAGVVWVEDPTSFLAGSSTPMAPMVVAADKSVPGIYAYAWTGRNPAAPTLLNTCGSWLTQAATGETGDVLESSPYWERQNAVTCSMPMIG